jgi:hypothetical protein
MQGGTQTINAAAATTTTTDNKAMKFTLSFLIVTTLLSANTSYKLGLGNAALTPEALCSQNNTLSQPTPIKCEPVTQPINTKSTIKCDLPTSKPTADPIVSKCAPITVECPKPTTPIIEKGGKCDPGPTPQDPRTAAATPEPASYALLGVGLVGAGLARRFRKKA